MPRISLKYYMSSFLHIMVQGIDRETIFKEEFYKNLYLKLIKENSNEFNINILAYAIMDNHMHLLVYYNNINDVSKFMHKVNQNFAQIYNKNNNRVGYVFRNRYRCQQINNREYLYTVLAYIHFNPYKAGIVKKIENYKFSSYNQYINGNIDKEESYILFQTCDYIDIFTKIHQRYFYRILNSEKNHEQIINEFMKKNKIEQVEDIKKEKQLLIQLIMKLKNDTELKDKEICKLLGIGKNRITQLKKEGFGDPSP